MQTKFYKLIISLLIIPFNLIKLCKIYIYIYIRHKLLIIANTLIKLKLDLKRNKNSNFFHHASLLSACQIIVII